MLISRNPNLSPFYSANLKLLKPLTFASPAARPLFITCLTPFMAPPKVVAQYAKSNRSSCKECGKNIPAGSLRLGWSIKDPRGFDLTKWHHLDCFPAKARPFAAAEEIQGYYSLKSEDKEALKNLGAVAATKSSNDEDHSVEKQESKGSKKRDFKKMEEGGAETKEDDKVVQKKPKDHSAEKEESKGTNKRDFKKMEEGGAKTKEDDKVVQKKPKHGDGEEEIVFSISDIKTKYKDASLPPRWKAIQTVIFNKADDLRASDKVAAFDFDGCLVKTSLKRIGPDAWSLLYSSIPEKLQNLYNDGYKLVIFTNESNIERWKNKRQLAVDSKIGRLENFLKHVKVPMQVFIACGLGKGKDNTVDPFRKPNPGMWRLLEKHFNSEIAIDIDRSFFVGDAAGRSNDHSDADVKFAEAVGLKFYVPEEFFGA